MTTVVGNLDCEARWHGAVLPQRVLTHISAAATLMRFLFEGPIALWTPAPVDRGRLCELPGAAPLELFSGPLPTRARHGWGAFRDSEGREPPAPDRFGISVPVAIATARRVNDRRFAAALASAAGLAPPGATTVTSVEALRHHLRSGGAAASVTDQWICKAPLSAAGRDRVLGRGDTVDGEGERAVQRLLQRFAALTFEPWLARTHDLGVCAIVSPTAIAQRPPHTLLTTPRGGFCGISFAPPPLTAAQRAQLEHTVDAVGAALRDAGYLGAFNVDAFLYRDRDDQHHLRPLCEINARLSFGWIAAALADRYPIRELQFAAPPPDATLLLAPDAAGVAAWMR
jgi:hypothetical protein